VEGARDLLSELASCEIAPLRADSAESDICWLAYTGGTTGKSKGVMLSHRALVTMTATLYADWDWPADIRFLAATPISHAAGATVFPVMYRGGFTRLLPGFETETYCRTIQDEKITCAFLVPTIIYVLIDARETRARYDLSSLDMIVYGAAPMSPDRLLEGMRVFGPVFVQLYGQTEAPQCITTLRKVDHDPANIRRLGSCGRPSPLVQVKLLDADLNEVGIGEPGEICVRGPLVMEGYWKRPEATQETLKGGWLHTGDVAVRDAEGYLYIVDRTKDMIISGGFNIYPREVEDALMAHPRRRLRLRHRRAGREMGRGGEGFVVLKPRRNGRRRDVAGACEGQARRALVAEIHRFRRIRPPSPALANSTARPCARPIGRDGRAACREDATERTRRMALVCGEESAGAATWAEATSSAISHSRNALIFGRLALDLRYRRL
jgi:fatty-acyl-CoA synthase